MLSEINRLSAQILIEASLLERGCLDETRPMEVQQALDSLKDLATPKEWDLGHVRIGWRHGSYYLRTAEEEEAEEEENTNFIREMWEEVRREQRSCSA